MDGSSSCDRRVVGVCKERAGLMMMKGDEDSDCSNITDRITDLAILFQWKSLP